MAKKKTKKKANDFIDGFEQGANWAIRWVDFTLRTGEFDESLEDELSEMR